MRALQRLDVLPKEAVFIDDLPANIEAASAMGIHTIHYTPDKNAGDLIFVLDHLELLRKGQNAVAHYNKPK
jgi:FMN phosphatase YigB (HAD superfamily)